MRHTLKLGAGLLALTGAALGLALPACSAGAASDSFSPSGAGEPTGSGGTAADGGALPPPEKEVESDYEAPVATKNFVWVANPKSGRVAYVNASTLEVKTLEAGNGPTFLATVPGQADAAIVLNVLSHDATLLKAEGAQISTKTFRVGAQANGWSLSPDGRWAIAWTDYRKIADAKKTQGYQDLAVIDLTEKVAPTILAVGYRPVSISFAENGSAAFAVTQDGISIVDLTPAGGPLVTKNVAISDTPLTDPGTRDVAVTPNGKLALIRRDGSSDITAVNLDTAVRTAIPMPGAVTDLDLTDNGTRAVGVIRDTSTVVILPVPDIVTSPGVFTQVAIPGETVGSVALSPGGSTGLLYSNAVAAERLTVLSLLGAPTFRTVRLYAPVLGVFSSKDASHALVVHDKVTGSPGAFSIVPVQNPLPAKIVETLAPPIAVAFADTNDRVIVAERGTTPASYGAYLGRLPQLTVDRFALASPPTAVGIVTGAKRAYVAQEHPDGRITFIDLDTGLARTLTGFELGARVVDGSKP